MNDATLILAGARLWQHPAADCLVLRGGRVAQLGRWQDFKAHLGSSATVKDVSGLTVLPGLGDAHVHFTATGFLATALDCKGVKTVHELLDRLAAEARRKRAGELILGLRLEHLEFPSKRLPTLDELEAAAPENPVYLRHITGHASVANRQALARLDFPAGQPGVTLGPDGQPTGYLIAQATQAATQAMYALNAEQLGYEAAFQAAAQKAAARGCTVVHALDDLAAVRRLLELERELPVRVLPYAQTFDVEAVVALGLPRIGGCHACALDGDFDMHTAALSEPYAGLPDQFGLLYQTQDALEAFVLEAHARGLQCAFHAVGDRAVEQALRVFEKAQAALPRPDARHRIEHAQLIGPDHLERAKRAGVMFSLQPAFNDAWDHHTYEGWVGQTRAQRVDPLRSFYEAGIPLAGGSDSTVTDLAPLTGIHAAVNHSRPEERLGLEEAVDLFTRGVAYGTHHENRRGKLAPGYDADLTLLSEDPKEVDPTRLKHVGVAMTIVRGQVVFEA